jgi:hypothetical protein
MKIISETISLEELKQMVKDSFADLVKAVVDVDREIIAIDGELHADLEALLIENGSNQANLWGVNFYPDIEGEGFIEFDSVINIRPSCGNRSRGVDDEKIRNKIIEVVKKRIKR